MAVEAAPWWRRVDDTAQLITSMVNAAAARAGRDGVYLPPRGSPAPRRRRRAASLRHLAEVIRTHRMAPGTALDKDDVAGVLAGGLRHLSDPAAVVAVARAAHHIAGTPFGDDDARRLAIAVAYLNVLLDDAREADRRAPGLLPVPRPPSALIGRRRRTAEVSGPARSASAPSTRTGGWWRGPVPWLVVLVVFASGVLVGVAGSRSTGLRPGADAVPPAATPECVRPGDPRPSGSVLLGSPGTPGPSTWWPSPLYWKLTATPGGFVADVPAGSVVPSAYMAVRGGLTWTAGRRYRIDFTVTSDRPVHVLLRIQDSGAPEYREVFSRSVPAGPASCRHSFTFEAGTTSVTTGEVTFQLGGQGACTVTVDDAVLVDLGA
ncbi:hypothetical protein J2S43_003433 [Catenuloplanes nepalensis]|uniref:Uncharacterized protein n=1 Tax=Catenuloplanes nepalensis TaxID=587533 RepID=A0ABT9MTZ1_9ACTN|nr:hypothetical protein [Catenuloplanes nepalensis]MDP9794921.1 hypothetical protein [Catenuloplanes nepalensis]